MHDRELPSGTSPTSIPAPKTSEKSALSYNQQLKRDFSQLINDLTLNDLQKKFMHLRWLDQVLWMEGRAVKSRNWYRRLRFVTIVGGVILPAFLTLNLKETSNEKTPLFWATFGLSQTVAICAAIEQFYNHGDRWRHYRRSVESLKTQGWQFFELTGPYEPYAQSGGHPVAFALFSKTVETLIQQDVEIYATQIIQDKKSQEPSTPTKG